MWHRFGWTEAVKCGLIDIWAASDAVEYLYGLIEQDSSLKNKHQFQGKATQGPNKQPGRGKKQPVVASPRAIAQIGGSAPGDVPARPRQFRQRLPATPGSPRASHLL